MRLDLTHASKVERIFFDPSVFDDISDDHGDEQLVKGGPYYKTNMAKTILSSPMIYILNPEDDILFMLTMRTITLYEVHTIIPKKSRGKGAIDATLRAARWMFENTDCEKIVTYIPTMNRKAKLFAKLAGMKDEGVCTKSFRKNGKLYDQWVLGLEKEALCQP